MAIIIKNSKELAKLVNKNKDLILKDQDVRIEYQVRENEIRDVYCQNLFLMNNDGRFDFNGGNFNGWDFNGRDFNSWNFNGRDFNGRDFNGRNFNGVNFNGVNFNGWDFNGRDFNGRDFNGGNFNGWNFNGENISYYGWFIVCKDIRCKSIIGRRENCFHKCLDGRLIIKSEGKSIGKIEGEIIEEN